jgi:thiamine-phosphate pyrophosphorylase
VIALPAPLLVITDRHQARQPIEAIAEAVGRGGWLLFRDKDLAAAERRAVAVRLARIAAGSGMHFSISADVALAAELGASVHLQAAAAIAPARARLPAGSLIGLSAHTLADVAAAAAQGADYVTLSPIFMTASKPGYGPALGIGAIAPAVRLGIPVVALGGIGAAEVGPCLTAGAAGVAVMGEVMRAGDPAAAVGALMAACKAATGA